VSPGHRLSVVALVLLAAGSFHDSVATQAPAVPRVSITAASTMVLPGAVDSNSPAIWSMEDGVTHLAVITSSDGAPRISSGPALNRFGAAQPVVFNSHPGHGLWMEAVVVDDDGTWYGY
jgi:hypothetical protein